jgi:hypothetical protein
MAGGRWLARFENIISKASRYETLRTQCSLAAEEYELDPSDDTVVHVFRAMFAAIDYRLGTRTSLLARAVDANFSKDKGELGKITKELDRCKSVDDLFVQKLQAQDIDFENDQTGAALEVADVDRHRLPPGLRWRSHTAKGFRREPAIAACRTPG